MNENARLVLEKTVAQLSDSWDWCAALCGAASGLVVMRLMHSNDYVSAVGEGVSFGIVVKKFIIACIQRPLLGRRAKKFKGFITRFSDIPGAGTFLQRLDFETQLWREGLCSSAEFKKILNSLIDNFRASFISSHPSARTAS